MENTNFNQLLYKYMHGQLSEPERIKFEAWLEVRKKENMTDLELSTEDEEKLFQKITNNLDTIEDVVAFRPKGSVKSMFGNRWIQIAASLLILFVSTFTIWYLADPTATHTDAISANEIEKVILNDGTIVWLRKHSKLTYYQDSSDGMRHADLTGEALFEVAKNPNSPFAISCGDITVRVLGTSFSLKTDRESIELTVLTGRVSLSSIADQKGVEVAPNEKVIYNTNGTVQKIQLSNNDIANITARTDYNMQFQNTAMEVVFEKIEKKFDVQMTVENKQLTKCRVAGDFTDKSLEQTLQMLSELMELDYTIDGNAVAVSGKGCN
jgi:transmembrane sensor